MHYLRRAWLTCMPIVVGLLGASAPTETLIERDVDDPFDRPVVPSTRTKLC